MTATDWPAPDPAEHVPLTWGKYLLIFIGVFAVALFVAAGIFGDRDSETRGGGDFYAQAGWTVQRAADLSVDIRRDYGTTRAVADCAMRKIVGASTWPQWRALDAAGELAVISAAQERCED